MVGSPEDVKKLSSKELTELAYNLRQKIIEVVSKTGGHLASSLGVVELTIAIAYVFSFLKDKIIWDVGHQSYAYKLLTGRWSKFHTLRQIGGISGFPKTVESPYDHFDTGHASTSISVGLGMAIARDLKQEDYKVVCVIGDGAIGGGMAFEALNHAGQEKRDILVILNSNEMSISETVGALAKYINKLITLPIYVKFREDMNELIKKLPLGKRAVKISHKIEEGVKGMIVPGILFEELGFRYIGPIDGHNLPILINTLKNIKDQKGPILLHVITKKGRGYRPAEENPEWFHGTSPFDIETGKPFLPQKKTYSQVFGEIITELARDNEKIVTITPAMKEGCGLSRFFKEFPKRAFDVGICEEHAVTLAAGMAKEGLKPFVCIYSTFLQRSYDQIVHDVALQNLPVVFMVDRGGIVGEDGKTHQGLFDIAYLSSIPNMVLCAPSDMNEFARLIKTGIDYNGPFAIRYPRGADKEEYDLSLPPFTIPEGELLEEGKDCLIIAVGSMVNPAIEAISTLKNDGIYPSLINARFIKPIDHELIIKNIKKVVITVEEGSISCGFGMQVASFLGDKDVGVYSLGLPNKFIEHGKREELLEKYDLFPQGIANKVREILKILNDYK
ncbi:TPA: 1-deoxy-D-xylulose-5-phosphate synthase [bacterium]|nr:1-deoxy-D-xylulose-5-phosphate synthase [bacterium]